MGDMRERLSREWAAEIETILTAAENVCLAEKDVESKDRIRRAYIHAASDAYWRGVRAALRVEVHAPVVQDAKVGDA